MEIFRTKDNRLLIVILIVAIIGLTALVVWMGFTRPLSSTREQTLPELSQSNANVSPDHAVLITAKGQITEFLPGDVIVLIPVGATSTRGIISIVKREANMFPNAGEPGWTRPSIVNVEFQNEQEQPIKGFIFEKTLEICFGMTKDEWQIYIRNRGDYQIQAYNENPVKWEALPISTYPDRYQLCGKTDHLSLFALAIKGVLPTEVTQTKIYGP